MIASDGQDTSRLWISGELQSCALCVRVYTRVSMYSIDTRLDEICSCVFGNVAPAEGVQFEIVLAHHAEAFQI